MSGFDLVALMDEIFEVLATAGIGLNVPGESDRGGVRAGPPAPYVELPEVTYGEPGPGLDRIKDLGLTVIFGPANNVKVFRTALAALRMNLVAYANLLASVCGIPSLHAVPDA